MVPSEMAVKQEKATQSQIIDTIYAHPQSHGMCGYHGGSYDTHYFLRVIQTMSDTEKGGGYKL